MRIVVPGAGDGPNQNHAGPTATKPMTIAAATTRAERSRIAPTTAVLHPTMRKLVSHTPPSEAEAIVAG